MAALNVDCIIWIITVLGAINNNHTFIFELNFFSVKVKNFEETSGKFLAGNKTQSFFDLKQNQFLECQSKKLRVTSKFLSPTLNFQSH